MTDFGSLDRELVTGEQGDSGGEPSGYLVEYEYRPARDAPVRAGLDTQEHEEVGIYLDD